MRGPSRARAPACAAREKFSKKCFHVSQWPVYRAFKAIFSFLTFHERFTFHRFCESNVKRLQRFAHARNAREPLFTGTFRIDCEGESIFLIFVLLVTVFLNIIALIRARSYSVSAKKRNKFLCFALDFL